MSNDRPTSWWNRLSFSSKNNSKAVIPKTPNTLSVPLIEAEEDSTATNEKSRLPHTRARRDSTFFEGVTKWITFDSESQLSKDEERSLPLQDKIRVNLFLPTFPGLPWAYSISSTTPDLSPAPTQDKRIVTIPDIFWVRVFSYLADSTTFLLMLGSMCRRWRRLALISIVSVRVNSDLFDGYHQNVVRRWKEKRSGWFSKGTTGPPPFNFLTWLAKNCPYLQRLNLEGCEELTDEHMQDLPLRNLRVLILRNCKNVTFPKDDLPERNSIGQPNGRKLVELDIGGTYIPEGRLAHLPKTVEVLNLSECFVQMTERELHYSLPITLKVLDIRDCSGLTRATCEKLLTSSTQIVGKGAK